jgi:hypothetical protein
MDAPRRPLGKSQSDAHAAPLPGALGRNQAAFGRRVLFSADPFGLAG